MSKPSAELDNVEECSRHIKNYDKTTKLAPIVGTCVSTSACSQQRSRRYRFNEDLSFTTILPEQLHTGKIEDLDESMRLLLIQIFVEEIWVNAERSDNEKQDFIEYCQTIYRDKPHKLQKLSKFERNYDKKDAIRWYTRSDTFISRIVGKVCARLDPHGAFKTRLILCDLYEQLKELHDKQLEGLRRNDLVVHRGALISEDELNGLKKIGELCMTRPFLATTTDESVAKSFSGDRKNGKEKIPVMITMKIDSKQIEDGLLARIDEVSANPDEKEVMLFRRLLFRIKSYDEIKDGSTYLVHIEMIRREEEIKIERSLRKKHLLLATATSSPLLNLLHLLQLTDYYRNIAGQAGQTHVSEQYPNPQTRKQLSSVPNIQ